MEGPLQRPLFTAGNTGTLWRSQNLRQKAHGYDEWCPEEGVTTINDYVTFIEVWLEENQ
ncbi:hypothetical protein ACLK1S_12635 [Escherichia coli]